MHLTTHVVTTTNGSAADVSRFCGSCGYQNPGDVAFCLNCTAGLGDCCPNCSQTVPSGSKFCGQCGTRLTGGQAHPTSRLQPAEAGPNLRARMPAALAEKISVASVKTLGERREVTVLLVNAANFTAAAHTLDREEVYLIVDEAMSLLADIIYKYEGTIDRVQGGLMALFGAPVAHENDPERAVRAALEIRSKLRPWQDRLKQSHGVDLPIRVGINTGLVIAGKVGSDLHMEYTVIGETVNLASRLESAAKPNTILVSAETYRRTRPLFQFEPLDSPAGESAAEPLRAYQPLAVLDRTECGPGPIGWPAPMIGRAGDLAQLQDALTEVRWQGQRWIALVTGDAGIGKSRLIAEFRQAVDLSEIKVYQGNCLTYGRSIPLWVAADLLRNMMHLGETASGDLHWGTLRAYLSQFELDQPDILPYLAHVLGLAQPDPQLEARLGHLDAAMLQRQVHTALRQVILAEARQAPTVLIFEDLHWIDPASREFLEYLVQTGDEVPLLLVLVSRRAERETVLQPLLAAAKTMTGRLIDLQLQALSASEEKHLVDQLIKQSTPEAWLLKRQLVKRAEGNPFYLEEIIRMLIDQDALIRTPESGAWQVLPQANELLKSIPGTVKGLIMARLDRLPEAVRQTLQTAAVIGTSFPVDLLHKLSNLSPSTLAAHLEELEVRQFLVAEPFQLEPGCIFRHALIQETIYGTLLKRDQRQIHTQVAEAIQASSAWSPEAQAEALAYHYVESATPTEAVPYLIMSAKNAARRSAHEMAIEHYRRTLKLIPDQLSETTPEMHSKEFFMVRVGLGHSLKYVGAFGEAGQFLSDALSYLWPSSLVAEAVSLWPYLIEALGEMADIRQREGTYEEALKFLDAGIQVLGETGPQEHPKLWRSLLERMAWIRFRQGQYEEALVLANTLIDGLSSDEPDDPITLAKLYNTLGGIAWQQGNRDEAIDYVQRSLQLYDSAGYLWGVATAYGNLGILYDVLGNWSKAAECHAQAQALQQTIGDIEGQARSFENLGLLHMVTGEHSLARQEMDHALTIRQRLGDGWGLAQSHINLAHLTVVQSRYDEAAAFTQAAVSLADVIGSSESLVPAHWILALVQAEQGATETGLKSAEQALKLARKNGFMEGEIDSLRVLGVLQGRIGRYQQAETYLHDSAALSEKQHNPYRQGLARLELGRMYRAMAEGDKSGSSEWIAKAVTALDEAVEKFESLGACYDLRQAKSLLNEISGTVHL